MFNGGYVRGLFTGAVLGICTGLLITAKSTDSERPTQNMNSQYFNRPDRPVNGGRSFK